MGEVLVIPQRGSQDSYRMQLPYADKDGIDKVVNSVSRAEASQIFKVAQNEPETTLKDTGNHLEITPEMAYALRVRRIQELLAKNMSQTEIIEMLYRVRPGGSADYARARDEVRSIISVLAAQEV
jgi:Trp operon repressor